MTDHHRGPIDRLLSNVPIDALIRQIDVQAIVERVDLNALLDQVDVDRLLRRIDVNEILTQVDVGALVAESTKGVAGRALDSVRHTAARFDLAIERVTDRLLRRSGDDEAPSRQVVLAS